MNTTARRVLRLAALTCLAGIATTLFGGPGAGVAAAAPPPSGYYSVSPAAGSTTQGATFAFETKVVLIPDSISGRPKVNWGDGTVEEIEPVCRRFGDTGRDRPWRECLWDAGTRYPVILPTGTLWFSESHTYEAKGTYTPKLTYHAGGVPSYSVSWKVDSPGIIRTVPFNLAYDASKVDVTVSPAPSSDRGWISNRYGNVRAFQYPVGARVTVTATPKTGNAVTGFVHPICDVRCVYQGGDFVEAPLGLGTQSGPSRTFTTDTVSNPDPNGYDNDGSTGRRTLQIDTAPIATTATATALDVTPADGSAGGPVVATAKITEAGRPAQIAGLVQFQINGKPWGPPVRNGLGGVARQTWDASTLPARQSTITAVFTPDGSEFVPSTSNSVTFWNGED